MAMTKINADLWTRKWTRSHDRIIISVGKGCEAFFGRTELWPVRGPPKIAISDSAYRNILIITGIISFRMKAVMGASTSNFEGEADELPTSFTWSHARLVGRLCVNA